MADIDNNRRLHPGMTVLDVVSSYRETEAVFKRYEERVGDCICCQSLFDTLKDVAERYGLDMKVLLKDLEAAAGVLE